MGQANRDQNQVATALGSFNGVTTTLKVENATGYLKAVIFNQALSAPAVDAPVAAHDQNSVHSSLGLNGTTLKTLKVTTADGYLRAVDVA